jgi:hypothetical protein
MPHTSQVRLVWTPMGGGAAGGFADAGKGGVGSRLRAFVDVEYGKGKEFGHTVCSQCMPAFLT